MVKRIEYKKGQEVGSRGIKYLEERPKSTGSRPYRRALFECHCGNEFEAIINGVSSGSRISCGCLAKEHLKRMSKNNVKHNMSRDPIYKVWLGIVTRCTNEKNFAFKKYGARGIGICKEWLDDCFLFIDWAKSNGYRKGLQIDRIDNSKGYSPDNCRFVTPLVNSRNKGTPKNSRFGIAGITWEQNKYRVRINVKGKKVNVGAFDDFFEACCARKSAEISLWKK